MDSLIVKFMDALQLDCVALVGNNSDGALCQMMVARHPHRIERLILTSCDVYNSWLPLVSKYFEVSAFIPRMIWLLAQIMRLRFVRRLQISFGRLCKRIPFDVSDAMVATLA